MQTDNNKISNKTWATIILGWLLVFFLIWVCVHQANENHRLRQNAKVLGSNVRYFQNQNNTLSAEVGTLKLSAAEMKDYIKNDSVLKKQSNRFSLINTVVKTITTTKIDCVKVPFPVKIPCDFKPINDSVKNFFSRYYPYTELTNSNPNISLSTLVSAEKAVPGSSFLSRLGTFALGALAGAAVK